MSLKIVAGAVLLASVFCAVTGWQNGFDHNLYVDCHTNKALYAVRSYHSNHHEDRRWHFFCKHVARFNHCYWTGYQNAFDQPLLFMCPVNYVMTGVSSYHSNHHEDRRWRFKCCRARGRTTKNCQLTGFINNWDAYMNHNAGSKVYVGAFSYHNNHKEDRLWKMMQCNF